MTSVVVNHEGPRNRPGATGQETPDIAEENARLRHAIEILEGELRQREARIQELDATSRAVAMADVRDEHDPVLQELDAVYASTSWRLTAPLRFASRHISRARGLLHKALFGRAGAWPLVAGLAEAKKQAEFALSPEPEALKNWQQLLQSSPDETARSHER